MREKKECKGRKEERGRGRKKENDRTKGRGLGACVPTQQYGEFREAAQYPPDRQLIDILPHARHVRRAVPSATRMSCHAVHRANPLHAATSRRRFSPRLGSTGSTSVPRPCPRRRRRRRRRSDGRARRISTAGFFSSPLVV